MYLVKIKILRLSEIGRVYEMIRVAPEMAYLYPPNLGEASHITMLLPIMQEKTVVISGLRSVVMEYEFRRTFRFLHELVQDGAAKVVQYETDQTKLFWHESLESFMDNRATQDEWIDLNTRLKHDSKIMLPRRFADLRHAVQSMQRTQNSRGLMAMSDAATIRAVNRLLAKDFFLWGML
jgi:hypothetical protein